MFKAARVKICTADPFFVFNGELKKQSGTEMGKVNANFCFRESWISIFRGNLEV